MGSKAYFPMSHMQTTRNTPASHAGSLEVGSSLVCETLAETSAKSKFTGCRQCRRPRKLRGDYPRKAACVENNFK